MVRGDGFEGGDDRSRERGVPEGSQGTALHKNDSAGNFLPGGE